MSLTLPGGLHWRSWLTWVFSGFCRLHFQAVVWDPLPSSFRFTEFSVLWWEDWEFSELGSHFSFLETAPSCGCRAVLEVLSQHFDLSSRSVGCFLVLSAQTGSFNLEMNDPSSATQHQVSGCPGAHAPCYPLACSLKGISRCDSSLGPQSVFPYFFFYKRK